VNQRRPRATPEQIARRRDAALKLYKNGYSVMQIVRALDTDNGTVSKDLDVVFPNRPKRVVGKLSLKPEPEPIDWRTDPVLENLGETVTRSIKSFLAEMKGVNYRNAFAHAVDEARNTNARAWITEARSLAGQLIAVGEQLRMILENDQHRAQMATTVAGRDDMRFSNDAALEDLITRTMKMLEEGYTQRQIGIQLGLDDASMRLAAAVAVARERLRLKNTP